MPIKEILLTKNKMATTHFVHLVSMFQAYFEVPYDANVNTGAQSLKTSRQAYSKCRTVFIHVILLNRLIIVGMTAFLSLDNKTYQTCFQQRPVKQTHVTQV